MVYKARGEVDGIAFVNIEVRGTSIGCVLEIKQNAFYRDSGCAKQRYEEKAGFIGMKDLQLV